MKIIHYLFLFIVIQFQPNFLHSQSTKSKIQVTPITEQIYKTGPYLGQPLPGKTPEIFAPGILSFGFHENGYTLIDVPLDQSQRISSTLTFRAFANLALAFLEGVRYPLS